MKIASRLRSKTIVVLILALTLAFVGCTRKVSIVKFDKIYPGMHCVEVDDYLTKNKLAFDKKDKEFILPLDGAAWDKAMIVCGGEKVSEMHFHSKKAAGSEAAKAYIDAQTGLMEAFRDQTITYEEGNKVINFNNGVKLHQFPDAKTGMITNFIITIDDSPNAKPSWDKLFLALPKIGASK